MYARSFIGEKSWRRGVSIGETLAEARRQAGLTITQVSQQTRIRESIIRSIEQGDFSPCGGDFYARGHIRSIASVVGADPAPLVREYDTEHGPPGSISAADVFEPATPIRIREPRRSFGLGKIMVVALLAVIGYGAYYFVSNNAAGTTATPSATVRPAVSKKPTVSDTPTAVAKPHSPLPESVIRLTAIKNCWVALTTTSGQRIYGGIVQAGQTKVWRELHTVSMTLGNPGGVVLTVNGVRQTPNPGAVVTLSINPGKPLAAQSNAPISPSTGIPVSPSTGIPTSPSTGTPGRPSTGITGNPSAGAAG
jgi:transcriptional regulator with XRE-family HTH domain